MLQGRKRRPTHPGAILRTDVLPATGLTQKAFAALLGVSRRTINEIMQEKRPVTVDIAHRLARALGTSPDVWLGLQQDVDLWDTLQANKGVYDQIKPLNQSAGA
ncbi:MAG: HigA family addiction module antitoxin [Pyrinomonadaceae bacterium]